MKMGRPRLRWLEDVEAESEEMKAEADGREGWASVVMEVKVLGAMNVQGVSKFYLCSSVVRK
jgi:hypothetical protein